MIITLKLKGARPCDDRPASPLIRLRLLTDTGACRWKTQTPRSGFSLRNRREPVGWLKGLITIHCISVLSELTINHKWSEFIYLFILLCSVCNLPRCFFFVCFLYCKKTLGYKNTYVVEMLCLIVLEHSKMNFNCDFSVFVFVSSLLHSDTGY